MVLFYTGKEKGELLHHGRSKEKRQDLPLVTLALMMDESGFPRWAEIYPGNVSEPSIFQEMVNYLKIGKSLTVIMDVGISTKKKGIICFCNH